MNMSRSQKTHGDSWPKADVNNGEKATNNVFIDSSAHTALVFTAAN